MTGKAAVTEFEEIIQKGRDRRKAEALAARIFGRDDRSLSQSSTSSRNGTSPSAGGSLASRVGVKKPPSYQGSSTRHQRPQRRAAAIAEALIHAEQHPYDARASASIPTGPSTTTSSSRRRAGAPTSARGMTIRGLAGPFVVMAQNFAPGTTAADIESAMTPIGGLIRRCCVVKVAPIVIAEIEFESREGAENVIATFDNQTADGRVLHVYHKTVGTDISADPLVLAPSGPRAQRDWDRDDSVVDGSYGFSDTMEVDAPREPAAEKGKLYSDSMVGRRARHGRSRR